MAAALLKELGADGFVSSVTVNAANKQVEAKGCVVEDLKTTDSGVSFDRLDECSPFPIPDDAKQVLALYPTILDLSRYTLKVTGLKDGSYNLKVGDAVLATLSANELATGVNLTELAALSKTPNPISAQGKAILNAVGGFHRIGGQNVAVIAFGEAAFKVAVEQHAHVPLSHRMVRLMAHHFHDANAGLAVAILSQTGHKSS
jgi:hypothetical protein